MNEENRRILLIDDTPPIHDDFRKILVKRGGPELESLESELFGERGSRALPGFELDAASQGEEGVARLRRALEEERPYALAFVDMRMPPGWGGIETVERLWESDPRLQVVICTAYSDHSFADIERLGAGDRLLILKKPFDAVEVYQLACALTAKWNLSRQAERKMALLEGEVRQRTAELEAANLELVQARDEARRASRVKSEFLASMSHELRTPMNAILGMTHLALLTELSPAQRVFVSKARISAEALMAMVDDILDYSRLDSGKLQLERVEFVLERLLERVEREMGKKAREKGLIFRLRLDRLPSHPLLGDPTRLEQVLLNLCQNGVKFTESGSVSLRAETVAEGCGSVTLGFSVKDTGIGIPAAEMGKLFRPFQQVDTSNTRRFGGAGMGLAVSRELVELMGGELRVESEQGKGSEFSFRAEFGLSGSSQGEVSPGLSGMAVASGIDHCCDDPELQQRLQQRLLECTGAGGELKEGLPRGEREESSPGSGRRTIPHEAVRGMLSEMTLLFYRDLDRALGLKELLARELKETVLEGEFERLARRMDEFDFEGALEVAAEIEEKLQSDRERGDNPQVGRGV